MKEKETPVVGIEEVTMPEVGIEEKPLPSKKRKSKDVPDAGLSENVVVIGGKKIEIKPTKLKYYRNNVAAFYRVVDILPMNELISMPAGSFGDDRDGDKALMDWLISVVDDEDIIVNNYNDIDIGTIERMLSIFKRLNKIDEKEEKAKNAASRAMKE